VGPALYDLSQPGSRAMRVAAIPPLSKTADVSIAIFCIEHRLPLLFSDKDFKPFVKYLTLAEAG